MSPLRHLSALTSSRSSDGTDPSHNATRPRKNAGTAHRFWLGLSAWLVVAGCGSGDGESGPRLPEGSLDLSRIEWSQPLPSMTGPGHVSTVAEAGDDVALYSDLGIFVWSSGSTAGSDVSIRTWRDAAAVPALGIPGTWLVGVDGEGRLHRLRNGLSFGLEDITARYALTGKAVYELVASGSGSEVVFALENQLAITDGTALRLFDVSLRNLIAHAGRVAGFDASGLRIVEPKTGSTRRIELSGLVGLAFSPDGALWAATADALYVEKDGGLTRMHRVSPGQQIRGLAGSLRGIWIGLADESALSLALLRDGQLLQPATRPALPPDARLLGSPSGDVWVVSSDGQLSRYGQESGGGRDLALWRETLLPLFGRHCQGCHLPNGSAHIDMTTYGSWTRLRSAVLERVVNRTPSPMPPDGSGMLSPDERAAVSAWATRSP